MDQNLTEIRPAISVVMPVYNAEVHLAEAIESILNQTFKNFEFIIINDGSNDDSERIIHSFRDDRIRYLKNENNLGLIKTLNLGIDHCRSDLIARMDADDIAMPERFQKQYDYLFENPHIYILGSWYRSFSLENVYKHHQPPVDHDAIKVNFLSSCPIAHPSVLGRKDAFKNYYSLNFEHAEDLDLWCRLISKYSFANVNEYLLDYRVHDKQVSSSFSEKQLTNTRKIRSIFLSKAGLRKKKAQRVISLIEGALTSPPTLLLWFAYSKNCQILTQWNKASGFFEKQQLKKFLTSIHPKKRTHLYQFFLSKLGIKL